MMRHLPRTLKGLGVVIAAVGAIASTSMFAYGSTQQPRGYNVMAIFGQGSPQVYGADEVKHGLRFITASHTVWVQGISRADGSGTRVTGGTLYGSGRHHGSLHPSQVHPGYLVAVLPAGSSPEAAFMAVSAIPSRAPAKATAPLPSCEEVAVGTPCTPADPTEGGRVPQPNGPASDAMATQCAGTDNPQQWQSSVIVRWNPNGSVASLDGALKDCVSFTVDGNQVRVQLLNPVDQNGQPAGELYYDTKPPVFEEQPVGQAPQEGGRHLQYRTVGSNELVATVDRGFYPDLAVIYLQYSPCGSGRCD